MPNDGSETRDRVLTFIKEYIAQEGYPPSYEKISDACFIGQEYVYRVLNRLEAEGKIRRPRRGEVVVVMS